MGNFTRTIILLLLALLALAACSTADAQLSPEPQGRLRIVATTSIVGDVVAQIGGPEIDLAVLLPVGVDPHGFDPSPQDIARIARAQVVFINGLGLETFLDSLLESAGGQARIVSVSEGVPARSLNGSGHDPGEHTESEAFDPHVWTDPNNVLVWAGNIASELAEIDPQNAAAYAANARAYEQELEALDEWVREQISRIPPENRNVVTDHDAFGYLFARYGLRPVGAVLPGFSTLAEPSAQEMATLQETIGALNVRAIFVGNTVNPGLARRVSEDTGTELVFVYTGSLSEPGGPAASYLEYMRFNVGAIVDTLS
jgi:ABC-type Zn uptake system ZnuABC Zn-binding protein ZnuA